MEFKPNKLTLLLLSAPLIANAGISLEGDNSGALPQATTDTTPQTAGHFIIGSSATKPSSMTIDNGSVLNVTDTLHIGNNNNNDFSGKVTVTGAGSKLESNDLINVGNYSNGSLSVLNGGKVTTNYLGQEPTPHFWGWFRHVAPLRTFVKADILIDGQGSELSYAKTSKIRVAGIDDSPNNNTTVNLTISNGGKLSAGTLQLEDGTTNIQIGKKSTGGVFDVKEISIAPKRDEGFKNITVTFDQTDSFEFKPEITAKKSTYKPVNFVQSGTGTTLFAPTSMNNVNSKIDIIDGTLKVGRDNVFLGAGTKTNEINIGSKGTLALNGHNTDALTVNNEGTIRLASDDESANKTLRVLDYTSNNGKLIVSSVWNNDSSTTKSDLLYITRSATGHTVVETASGYIEGDILRKAHEDAYSAPVVWDANINSQATFTGTAKTRNAGEAQLTKKDRSIYAWTLKAFGHDIYAAPVSGYIQMPRVNMELGYSVLDTLHQRRGEISQSPNSSVWARVSGKRLETEGRSRLDVDSSQYVAQVGYDFNRSEMQNGVPQSLSGVYFAYSRADSRFYDQYRAENGVVAADKYTGKGKTTAANIGVYHLYRAVNDAYVDTVAQFSYLTNKYNPNLSGEVRQHGWSGAVSVEGGHSFALGNSNWRLEPQTQLVYQHLKLQSFHDGVRDVAQGSDNNLRGRIGVRLSHSKDFQRNPTVYFVANIWHDFVTAKSVLIGDTKYGENYSRTWLEGGAGLNVPFGSHAIHADLRLEHSLGHKGTRSGAKAVLGYSYAW